MLVTLREPYRGALETGSATRVCDEPATIAVDLYGRALARSQVGGRDEDARQDLQILLEQLRDPEETFFAGVARPGEESGAALQLFHDIVQIELSRLDIRSGREVNPAVVRLEQIAERYEAFDPVRGRARHIGGYGHFKGRRPSKATDCLLEALSIFRRHDDARVLAEIQDTLGQVKEATGAQLVDLSDMLPFGEGLFKNSDHLQGEGTRRFSVELARLTAAQSSDK